MKFFNFSDKIVSYFLLETIILLNIFAGYSPLVAGSATRPDRDKFKFVTNYLSLKSPQSLNASCTHMMDGEMNSIVIESNSIKISFLSFIDLPECYIA